MNSAVLLRQTIFKRLIFSKKVSPCLNLFGDDDAQHGSQPEPDAAADEQPPKFAACLPVGAFCQFAGGFKLTVERLYGAIEQEVGLLAGFDIFLLHGRNGSQGGDFAEVEGVAFAEQVVLLAHGFGDDAFAVGDVHHFSEDAARESDGGQVDGFQSEPGQLVVVGGDGGGDVGGVAFFDEQEGLGRDGVLRAEQGGDGDGEQGVYQFQIVHCVEFVEGLG